MTIDFYKTEQDIYNFVQEQNFDYKDLTDKNYKLPLSDAIFCIKDIKRNKLYFQAIKKAINDLLKPKRKLTVVDAGSGTGILGLFALLLGADRCIFIEHNPYSLELNKKLIKHFGFMKNSIFINDDATKIKLKDKYDILISETIVSNLGREDFPLIINNLLKYGNKESLIIPQTIEININEKDKSNNKYHRNNIKYDSKKGFNKKNIRINFKETEKLYFKCKLNLYKDVSIKSGDCPLFINTSELNIHKDKHPLFNFIY